jgi:integrase
MVTRGRPIGQSDVLEPGEIEKLLSLPDRRTKEGARDYAVLLVFANTPMRKGELVNLNVAHLIDEGQQKYIAYQGLKKRSSRPYWLKIPIADDVHRGITRYIQMEHGNTTPTADSPLFLTLGKHGPYDKRRISPKAVDCLVEKYVKLAEILKRVTPHSFRATYLTLRAPGRDPATLMTLSGHSGLKSLLPYLRATEERRREAALAFSFA